jgi:hypothetical protein
MQNIKVPFECQKDLSMINEELEVEFKKTLEEMSREDSGLSEE